MRNILLYLAIFFAMEVCVAQKSTQAQTKEQATSQFPATGAWKVVSQTSGPKVIAIPNNDIFLSGGLLAEYDRGNTPQASSVSLYNVKWSGKAPVFSTKLYRSPSDHFKIERFAEQNVAAFCYLQLRNNSAVLLISETEVDGDPFAVAGPATEMDAHARSLTLFRFDSNAQPRLFHLKNHADMVARLYGNRKMGDPENMLAGGFLDEYRKLSFESSNLEIPAGYKVFAMGFSLADAHDGDFAAGDKVDILEKSGGTADERVLASGVQIYYKSLRSKEFDLIAGVVASAEVVELLEEAVLESGVKLRPH